MTRTYDDGCGIAHALDLVGERWALLVVRELLLGPKRFTDLRAGLPGVSANILSQRLRELEAVVLALGAWGIRSPTLPRDAHLGVDSVVLSLAAQLTHTDPPATYELRLGQYRFAVRLHDGSVDVSRGSAERPEAVITTTPRQLDAIVSGDRSLTDVVTAGEAAVEGDELAAARFATYFAVTGPES